MESQASLLKHDIQLNLYGSSSHLLEPNQKKQSVDGRYDSDKNLVDDVSPPHLDECGGGARKNRWKDGFSNFFEVDSLEKNKNNICPKGARRVEKYYERLKNNFNRLDCPALLDPKTATFDDIAFHALFRQRLSPNTVEKRMRYARFMENHGVPVDFRNPNFKNFLDHMDYREQFEFEDNTGISALGHEWKTMKMFLKAYGMDLWNYKPPSMAGHKARFVPLPDTVYDITHKKYLDDEYNNALIQYSLLHSFMIGWRNPSELCVLTVDDVNVEDGIVIITEPKKHYSTRMLAPGYSIMNGKNRKSFRYYLDHWRPKVENQYSKNAFYLREDGRPIEIDQYRAFIQRCVKPEFPKFHLYCTRHWCAIAKLISSRLETGTFDVYPVMNWLGHTQIQTTSYSDSDYHDVYS